MYVNTYANIYLCQYMEQEHVDANMNTLTNEGKFANFFTAIDTTSNN